MVKGDTINFSNSAKTFGYANLITSGAYANFSKAGSTLMCQTSGVYDFYIDTTAAADAAAIRVVEGSEVNYETKFYFNETATDTVTYNWKSNNATAENGSDIALGAYSILDKHHPVLCIFHFNETANPITIDVTTTIPYLATTDTLTSTGNPLSSIVKFSSKHGTEQDSEGHYIYSKQRLSDNFNSFATITNNVPAFTNPVNGVYTAHLWNGTVTGDRTVSLVIDYYPELIEYIYGHFIGNPLVEGEGSITFDRDWRWVIR